MRQIDGMNESEINTLKIKGMLKQTKSETKSQRATRLAAVADAIYAASEPIHVPGENDAYEQARHDANGGDE